MGRGIDDVAILTLTLSGGGLSSNDLTRIARVLQTEVAKTEDVGLTYLVGDAQDAIRIEPDPDRLALHGVFRGPGVAVGAGTGLIHHS